MTKKQHYMTRDERYKLEALLEAKIPVSRIAKQLGFCRQTIYNEIARGKYVHTCDWWDEERYSADKGQQIHAYNQTAKGRPLKIGNDHAYAKFLENKMLGVQADGKVDRRKRYSPAAALAEARKAGFALTVCASTLYSYIDKQIFLRLTNKDLLEKGKEKKRGYRPVRRVAHPRLPSISERPEAINSREESGHKEIDLIVGKRGSAPALLTMTDWKGRNELAFKIPDKRADFGGKRFTVYYCHSYSAWEKGTNENHDRLLRRFFPKGTDFSRVSQREIQEAVDWINSYPRKVLGWKSPAELEP